MAKKWVDYEFTPLVHHLLGYDKETGEPKIEHAPAKKVFIAADKSRRVVVPGGPEDEMLMAEVRKNNPEAHKEEKIITKIKVTKAYLAAHPELEESGVKVGDKIDPVEQEDSDDESKGGAGMGVLEG